MEELIALVIALIIANIIVELLIRRDEYADKSVWGSKRGW